MAHGRKVQVVISILFSQKNSSIVIEKDLGVLKIHYVELNEF